MPVWADAIDESLRTREVRTRILDGLAPQLDFVCGVPTSQYVVRFPGHLPRYATPCAPSLARYTSPAIHRLRYARCLLTPGAGRWALRELPRFNSGQQWDMPNGWAPLQYFIVESLLRLNLTEGAGRARFPRHPPARRTLNLSAGAGVGGNTADVEAFELAREWVQCNYCGWLATGAEDGGNMFEKYDVTRLGVPGDGGEYGVQEGASLHVAHTQWGRPCPRPSSAHCSQLTTWTVRAQPRTGFGWTNGVVLRFALRYADRLQLQPCTA